MTSEDTKYYKVYRETVGTDFEGTIVDIETIGDFTEVGKSYPPDGQDYLGRYKKIMITTVGLLSEGELTVHIAKDKESLEKFKSRAISIMTDLSRPTYAFNKSFEEGCYFWNAGFKVLNIDYELQKFVGEKKEDVVVELGISGYDDPYHGDGGRCITAFEEGKIDEIIKHNRACLLKEYQIFKKRGAYEIKTEWLNYDE